MLGFIGAAALAGIVGSPHCVGMCGGFALACGGRGRDAIPWHMGRWATYGMLGAAGGAVGGVVPGPGWVGAVLSTVLIVWFAGALAGVFPEPKVLIPGLSGMAGRLVGARGAVPRLVFGMVNGLLPCGLVYAALAIPVASGDPLTGALAMVAFGLATTPALTALLLGSSRLNLRSLRARRAMAVVVLLAGLYSVAIRSNLRPGSTEGHHHPGIGSVSGAGVGR